MIPGLSALGVSAFNVPLVAPGTEMTPRLNQVDLSVSKSVTFGGVKINPKIDLFNALNSSDYFTVRSNIYNAATYMLPGSILQGRIVRLAAVVNW